MFLLSFAPKLYVPIRSVQSFRDSVKTLYVPIRSVYVRYTFLNVFVKICWVMGSVDDDFNEACNTWIENSLPTLVERVAEADPLGRLPIDLCSYILGHPPHHHPSFCDNSKK